MDHCVGHNEQSIKSAACMLGVFCVAGFGMRWCIADYLQQRLALRAETGHPLVTSEQHEAGRSPFHFGTHHWWCSHDWSIFLRQLQFPLGTRCMVVI